MANEKIRVRLTRSSIGAKEPHKRTLRALGLRKVGDVREIAVSPAVLGMIKAVEHLVTVEQTG